MRESLTTVRKAFSLLDARERRAWLFLVPLAVLAALLESIGALLIFGLIGLMTDPEAALNIRAVAEIRTLFPQLGDRTFISIYAVLVGLFFLAKNLYRAVETYAQQRAASGTAVVMSQRLLARYLSAPYAFHLSHNSASLIRNTHAGVDHVTRTVLTSATAAMSELFVVIGIVSVLALAAPVGTLAATAFALIVTVPLLRTMQASYARWGEIQHDKNASLQRHLQEAFRGIKEIQVLSGARYFIDAFSKSRTALAAIQRRTATLQVIPRLAVETFFVLGIVGMFLVALRLEIQGGQLIAYLGLIAYALIRLLPSLHLLVYHLNNIKFGGAATDRLHADWQLQIEDREALATTAAPAPKLGFASTIRLDHVDFDYPDTSNPTLRDINLEIRCGEYFGIVGPTGAGKSTLMDLLLGLQAPTAGTLLVDGADLATVRARWQAGIGYVPQHPFFADDSVRRNVAFGVGDHECDDTRIWQTLEQAQLRPLIENLPEGLDTRVGESGIRLSGGERQRLAIARALYRQPDVLVLDEATSALDEATEKAIAESLQALRGKMTIILIAHRETTLRNCDRVAMLRDGKLVDTGTFEQLTSRFKDVAAESAQETARTP